MKLIDLILSLLIPGLILVHLIIAPYTKVEESFNIQAAHDVLVYGAPTSDVNYKLSMNYDHFTFPGAVPRTFIGAVLLAGLSQPYIALAGFHHGQLIVRGVLGLFNAASILFFASNIRRAYGIATARWYLLLQASQFHIIFYASRTLPNMFAFGLTTFAFGFLIPSPHPKQVSRRNRLAITLFVFAAAVFRSEVALLLGTTILYQLIIPTTSLGLVIPPFIISFLVALAISIPVDSYFWQKPLWPELWGFYFNAIQGSSSEWGVSPWYYYFVSALPRLLLNPLSFVLLLPLSLYHPATRSAANRLVIPSLLFMAIYSIQPHKEARFIFYVVPPLTAACALSANLIFNRIFSPKKGPQMSNGMGNYLLALALIISILVSFVVSTGMLLISSLNYPGGEALTFLRDTVLQSEGISSIASQSGPTSSPAVVIPAHADVLSCMTGVTLFGTATGSRIPNHKGSTTRSGSVVRSNMKNSNENGAAISSNDAVVTLSLDKTEDEATLSQPGFWTRFDYALAEDPSKVRRGGESEWETIGVVKGFGGVEFITDGRSQGEERDTGGNGAVIPVVGNGVVVEHFKGLVMALTKGRWVGPRMVPKVYIMKRVKEGKRERERGSAEA